MTSSDSSTSTVSPTKLSPSLSQYNFDPFAVHPFTNCASSNPNGDPNYSPNNPSYAHPHRQPLGNHPIPHAPIPSPLPQQPSSMKPYAYAPPRPTGIFVPFRKETSSPDLSDVLKSKSPPSTVMAISKTLPKNSPTFVPPSPSIGLSSSRKH